MNARAAHDAQYGLSRSSNDMRLAPDPPSAVVHALKAQERLLIVGESGDMLEVESRVGRRPCAASFRGRQSSRSSPRPAIFPLVDVGVAPTCALRSDLPAAYFVRALVELHRTNCPGCRSDTRILIRSGKRPSVGKQIREAVARGRAAWDAWVAEVRAEDREDTCTLDEWIVLMQGGRDMWSIRAERIFSDPSEHSATLGWVVPEDVLRWTGRVATE